MNVRFHVFFFFQAEDGIRDKLVTGVQTCALPIWAWAGRPRAAARLDLLRRLDGAGLPPRVAEPPYYGRLVGGVRASHRPRPEERRGASSICAGPELARAARRRRSGAAPGANARSGARGLLLGSGEYALPRYRPRPRTDRQRDRPRPRRSEERRVGKEC